MKQDGTILTPQIFQHIGEYYNGFIPGNAVSTVYDYIDLDGKIVLYNFHDTCSDFFNGVAYIVTHNWLGGGLDYHKIITPDDPLVENITKFFMN